MAEKIFTPEQLSAIETRDKTLLVSAAAGSGKTATLTERIIRSLIDENDPHDISRMLIVTFTNAAVDELRSRITGALKEKLLQEPSNTRLERQLYMLPNAKISTIDAFCNDILKNNAERFGISPTYRIADPAEAKILAHTIWSTLISAAYNGDIKGVTPEDFEELTSSLVGVKNDSALEEVFSMLYEKSKSHELGVGIFEKFAKELKEYINLPVEENPYGNYAMDSAKEIAAHYRELYANLRDRITYVSTKDEDYIVFLEVEKEYFTSILSQSTYEDMRNALNREFENAPRIKNKGLLHETFATVRENMKKAVRSCYDRYFLHSTQEWQAHLSVLYKLVSTLASFICEFDRLYFEEKKHRGVLEYSDIERLTYQSLYDKNGNLTELAYAQKEQYSDVYVDEYQDVNSIQNKIFEAVSKENNRFMVGDIKQSIYGFRSARPDIFAQMKNEFPPLKDADNSSCASIFMSKNFRCDRGILNFTNDIFHPLFTLVRDSIGYVPEDKLEYSKTNDGTFAFFADKRTPDIYLFTKTDKDGGDEKISTLPPAWVAERIKHLIKDNMLTSGKRITPSDIAIILRKDGGRAKEYADALNAVGINAKLPESKSFLDNSEIQLALCLLNAIDNPMRDIYLAGLMMSPLYDFTPDELYKIRKFGKNASLWDSLKDYALENENFQKGKEFIKNLNHYRAIAEGVKVDALIMRLYNETGLLALASKNGCKENLMLLYNYARKFEASSFEGLFSFINYINKLIESGAGFSAPKSSDDKSAVTIITVHKSKGLEFPVVFLADAATSLQSVRDKQVRVAYSEDFGIAMRTRVPNALPLIESPVYNAIIDRNAEKSIEEELRVYYVALTRAREMLFVTGAINAKDKNTYISSAKIKKACVTPYSLKEAKSFIDIVFLFDSCARISWNEDENTEEKTTEDVLDNDDLFDEENLISEFTLPEISGSAMGNLVVEDDEEREDFLSLEFEKLNDLGIVFHSEEERIEFFKELKYNLQEVNWLFRALHSNATIFDRKSFFEALNKTLKAFGMPPFKNELLEYEPAKDTSPDELHKAIAERLSYKYPDETLTTLPEKMSISKLYPSVLDGNDEDIRLSVDTTEKEKDAPTKVKLPDFVTGNSEYESSLRGIATHNFLQFFELRNFGVGKADSELKRLVEKEFMSKKDAERVRLNEIELFAKSKLLQKMQDAKKLYREFRFNVMLPAALFTENEEKKKAFEGREILLQGIIDCLIEDEDGNLHLVDYKTDRLTRAELADRALAQKTLSEKHKLQLTYYALAVEKMFSKKPKTVGIYSLPLGDTVELDIQYI